MRQLSSLYFVVYTSSPPPFLFGSSPFIKFQLFTEHDDATYQMIETGFGMITLHVEVTRDSPLTAIDQIVLIARKHIISTIGPVRVQIGVSVWVVDKTTYIASQNH